jgi:hypothetical protein
VKNAVKNARQMKTNAKMLAQNAKKHAKIVFALAISVLKTAAVDKFKITHTKGRMLWMALLKWT